MVRLALALVALTGCQLVFDGGHGGDDSCPPIAYDLAPAPELRNPDTGLCQGFPQPYPCDDTCGVCAEPANGVAQPNWASCFGECEAIAAREGTPAANEAACIAHPGCRAVYQDLGVSADSIQFRDCWGVAPTGPIKGACTGLDAQRCSEHDDCAAIYGEHGFERCVAEGPKTPACDTLSTEPQCSARPDCHGIYKGEDCTCTPTDCTCKILTYTRCEPN